MIENAIGNEYAYKYVSSEKKLPFIAAIGRLHPAKDYLTLVKAFEIVHSFFPNFVLNIYGDGPEKEKIELNIEERFLMPFVNIYHPCKDALLKIKDASCYCLSSKYEGMPNALMEAMAIGIPCISTDCPFGPSELIIDNYNGLLVPVGDYKKMAEAMIELIQNKKLATKLSTNGRKMLYSHSLETITNKYHDYIKSVFEKWKIN